MGEYICIDEFDIENDVFEITNFGDEDVSFVIFNSCVASRLQLDRCYQRIIKICIIGIFANQNQVLVGQKDQQEFWITNKNLECDSDPIKTDHIVLKKSKIISTGCTPSVLILSTALPNHTPLLIGFDGKFVFS